MVLASSRTGPVAGGGGASREPPPQYNRGQQIFEIISLEYFYNPNPTLFGTIGNNLQEIWFHISG